MINNYQRLLNMHYRNYFGFFVIVSLMIILTIYIFKCSLYEKIDLLAVSDGNNLIVSVPLEYSDTLAYEAILNINGENIDYEITSISELLYDETKQINYQNYFIKINKKYPLNEIVKVTFYYNKEKIFRKVIKFIKE